MIVTDLLMWSLHDAYAASLSLYLPRKYFKNRRGKGKKYTKNKTQKKRLLHQNSPDGAEGTAKSSLGLSGVHLFIRPSSFSKQLGHIWCCPFGSNQKNRCGYNDMQVQGLRLPLLLLRQACRGITGNDGWVGLVGIGTQYFLSFYYH